MMNSSSGDDHPLNHPLLKAVGCPASGNGAAVFLQHMGRSLESCVKLGIGDSAQDWMDCVRALLKQVLQLTCSPSPLAADLASHPWSGVHECITVSKKVDSKSTLHIDGVFALTVLNACAGQRSLTHAVLQGIKASYSALTAQRQTNNWLLLAEARLLEHEALEQLIKTQVIGHEPAYKFGLLVLSYLKSPMPTLAGLVGEVPGKLDATDAQASTSESEQEQADSDEEQSGEYSEDSGDTAADVSVRGHQAGTEPPKFTRGDSLIEWHRQRASYASHNNRLALESWDALPVEHTRCIAERLPGFLTDSESPWHAAAIVATACLLTSSPPQVLLHVPLAPHDDLYIDLKQQCFLWTLQLLRGQYKEPSAAASIETVRIPFPEVMAVAVRRLIAHQDINEAQYFSDLFGTEPGTAAWHGLLLQVQDLLKLLSDPAVQAFPGRWANSISRVYLEECKSDLMACVCSLDLRLVPQAALAYFHPSEQDVIAIAEKVYQQLGLKAPVQLENISTARNILGDDLLQGGFTRLFQASSWLSREVTKHGHDVHECVKRYNDLTTLVAAATVFLVAGRGSRTEEITLGALLCDTDFLWLEDKKVDHENSSRIVPKPSALKKVLHLWVVAAQEVAERLTQHLPRDKRGKWEELAAERLRFDALAFELLEVQTNRVARRQVLAVDIEKVAQKYFDEGKNFMRHVIITQWALRGKDRHLLRLITGHATAGLAMPAAGAMYTPISAGRAAGEILDQIVGEWLPRDVGSVSKLKSYVFVRLPGLRIMKVVGAHRDHIKQWDAPVFSRWHLAASRIVDRVRQALLWGRGPENLLVRLWLHLVVFDGVHESSDLELIFKDSCKAISYEEAGWRVSFARRLNAPALTFGVQLPTSILLDTVPTLHEVPGVDYQEVISTAGEWLCSEMPDCWNIGKQDQSSEIADALLAACSLWADWKLPTATQTCYASESQAPLLDHASTSYLLGGRSFQESQLQKPTNPRAIIHADLMDALYKTIHRLGSNELQLGESKKRARLFERWISMFHFPREGGLAGYLAQAVEVNVDRIRAARRSAIEFSSTETYLGVLKPFFQGAKDVDPGSFDTLQWQEFCLSLYAFACDKKLEKTPAVEAVKWLFGCWSALGYPVPATAQLDHPPRYSMAMRSLAIASVTDEHWDDALEYLHSFQINPLQQQRMALAVALLRSNPLRWGEVSCLSKTKISTDGVLCITTEGFSNLKSFSARRRLPLAGAVAAEFVHVAQLIEKLEQLGGQDDALIFGSYRDEDGVVRVDSTWLHELISSCIQAATGNPNFRIHALRADAISERLMPRWQRWVKEWKSGSLGPSSAKDLFEYNADRTWVTEEARRVGGHAHIGTTLSYYFHAWAPARQLALHATLQSHQPTGYLLKQLKVTPDALEKACQRVPQLRADPWVYLQRKIHKSTRGSTTCDIPALTRVAMSQSSQRRVAGECAGKVVQASEDFILPDNQLSQVNHVRYLGLRLLGVPQVQASTLVEVGNDRVINELESKLQYSHLDPQRIRRRIKGNLDGRAFKADVTMLLSESNQDVISLFFEIPAELRQQLLMLLMPRHEVLHWDEVLVESAPWLEPAPFLLQVIFDRRAVDLEITKGLARYPSILIGTPVFDVGKLPRVYILSKKEDERSTVAKARWTTLVRVLICAITLLHEEFQS